MGGSFFDTNVLVYLASADAVRADRAEAVLASAAREGRAETGVQALNELTWVSRRRMGLDWRETRALLDVVRALLKVHPLTIETHEAGLGLAERHGLSWWDALIVAAALHAQCDTLWSEDMQHGMVVEGRLRIANPFREAPGPSQ